jgi:hypothetical protein
MIKIDSISLPVSWLIIVLLSLLAFTANSAIFFQTPTPSTINAVAPYTFYLTDSVFNTGSTFTGVMRLTFDSTLFSFTGLTTPCIDQSTNGAYTCNISSPNIIMFKYPDTVTRVTGGSLTLVMSSVKNPPYLSNATVTFEVLNTNLSVYSSATTFTVKGYTTDTLTSCSVTFNPSTVSTLSTATFKLTPKNQIPMGGSIVLDFSNNTGYTPIDSNLAKVYTDSSSSIYLVDTLNVGESSQQLSLTNIAQQNIPPGTSL